MSIKTYRASISKDEVIAKFHEFVAIMKGSHYSGSSQTGWRLDLENNMYNIELYENGKMINHCFGSFRRTNRELYMSLVFAIDLIEHRRRITRARRENKTSPQGTMD